VASLQEQQQLLLRYTAQLIREKNVLVQRTLDLTERWNMSAAENLQLRSRLQDGGSSIPPTPQPPEQPGPTDAATVPADGPAVMAAALAEAEQR
jgi:hypothetical protein